MGICVSSWVACMPRVPVFAKIPRRYLKNAPRNDEECHPEASKRIGEGSCLRIGDYPNLL